jgi:TPR repeat protein
MRLTNGSSDDAPRRGFRRRPEIPLAERWFGRTWSSFVSRGALIVALAGGIGVMSALIVDQVETASSVPAESPPASRLPDGTLDLETAAGSWAAIEPPSPRAEPLLPHVALPTIAARDGGDRRTAESQGNTRVPTGDSGEPPVASIVPPPVPPATEGAAAEHAGGHRPAAPAAPDPAPVVVVAPPEQPHPEPPPVKAKRADEPAERHRGQSAEKSSPGAVEKPAEKPAVASVEKPAQKPAGNVAARTSDEDVDEPAVVAAAPEKPSRRQQVKELLAEGDALLDAGDVETARQIYEAAFDKGSADAGVRLGRTFDPAYVRELNLAPGVASPAEAVLWYQDAARRGNKSAADHLDELETWLENAASTGNGEAERILRAWREEPADEQL